MGRTARVSGVGPGSRATVRPAAGAVPATVGRSGLRGEEAAGRGGRQLLGVRRRRGAGAQVALDHGEGQIDHGEGDALAVLRRGGAEPPGQGGDGLAHPGVAARRPFGLRGGPLRVAELLRPAKQQRGPRGVPPTPGDHLAGRRRTRRHRVARRGEGVEPGRLEVLDGAQPERGEQRGPVREAVAGYVPGRWVRFAFTGPHGSDGFHEYTVHRLDEGRTALRHALAMRARGPALLSRPLLYRLLHDAVIEDSLDRPSAPARARPSGRRGGVHWSECCGERFGRRAVVEQNEPSRGAGGGRARVAAVHPVRRRSA
ncbi:hypothetical protein [Kitasatospora sp. NPDC050467]|uniref:hypothetical protein n=1 Tax=unclassified Kitasatospora TaxID=2633591 RepID=UPI0032554307